MAGAPSRTSSMPGPTSESFPTRRRTDSLATSPTTYVTRLPGRTRSRSGANRSASPIDLTASHDNRTHVYLSLVTAPSGDSSRTAPPHVAAN